MHLNQIIQLLNLNNNHFLIIPIKHFSKIMINRINRHFLRILKAHYLIIHKNQHFLIILVKNLTICLTNQKIHFSIPLNKKTHKINHKINQTNHSFSI